LTVSRYFVHAIVLMIGLAISGLTTVGSQLNTGSLRLGAENAQALAINEGGQVGNVSLGRFGTIVKPVGVPSAPEVSHQPIVYSIGSGDTLDGIATKFGLTINEIRWSNPSLSDTINVSVGDKLTVPPVHGVVVTFKIGDSIGALANSYHVDPVAILDYNLVRDPALVTPGTVLVIPGGTGPDFTPAPVAYQPYYTSYGASAASIGGPNGSLSNGRFPWGYCTWYVASRFNVTFIGNAYQWPDNARAQGYPEGMTPRAGAVMVTEESGYGHVAYVEAVNADGSWLVSEMNFVAFGVVDQRTIKPGHVSLVTFIYPK
jgi:LysM repeat protein